MDFTGYHGNYKVFLDYLSSLSEEKYRDFCKNLTPNSGKMLGVRVPALRGIAKNIAKTDWISFFQDAKEDTYEETMLQGLVIGYLKTDVEERIRLLRGFIPKIQNWAVCDVCCSTYRFAEKNRDAVFLFLQPYLSSDKEFDLRFAIVMLMDYFITAEYVDKVLQILNKIHHEGYYTKMAQAWAISVCFVKFPEKTIRFLQNNHLDDWTYNKALQKIIESLRVDKQTKSVIRSMKRIKSST